MPDSDQHLARSSPRYEGDFLHHDAGMEYSRDPVPNLSNDDPRLRRINKAKPEVGENCSPQPSLPDPGLDGCQRRPAAPRRLSLSVSDLNYRWDQTLREAFAAALNDSVAHRLASLRTDILYTQRAEAKLEFDKASSLDYPAVTELAQKKVDNADAKYKAAATLRSSSAATQDASVGEFFQQLVHLIRIDAPKHDDPQFHQRDEVPDIGVLQAQIEDTSQQISLVKQENAQLRNELNRLKDQIFSVDVSVSELKQRPIATHPDRAAVEVLKHDLTHVQHELTSANNQLKDFNDFREEMTSHRRSTNLALIDIKDCHKGIENFTMRFEQLLEGYKSQAEDLINCVKKDLEQQVENHERQSDQTMKVIHERVGNLKRRVREFETTYSKAAELTSDAKLRQKVHVLSDQVSNLECAVMNCLDSTSRAHIRKGSPTDSNSLPECIEVRLEKAEGVVSSLQSQLLETEPRLRTLETQLRDLQHQVDTAIVQCKSEIQSQLEEQHEVYNQILQQEAKNSRQQSEVALGEISQRLDFAEEGLRGLRSSIGSPKNRVVQQLSKDQNQPFEAKLRSEVLRLIESMPTASEKTSDACSNTSSNSKEILNKVISKTQKVDALTRKLEKLQTLYDKLDDFTQWQNHRFDNLTSEHLSRQMVSVIAPLLPQYQRALGNVEANVEDMRTKLLESTSLSTELISSQEKKIQLFQENLDDLTASLTDQYNNLKSAFEETRDQVVINANALEQDHVNLVEGTQEHLASQADALSEMRSNRRNISSPALQISGSSRIVKHRSSNLPKATTPSSRSGPRYARPSRDSSRATSATDIEETLDAEDMDEDEASAFLSGFQKSDRTKPRPVRQGSHPASNHGQSKTKRKRSRSPSRQTPKVGNRSRKEIRDKKQSKYLHE